MFWEGLAARVCELLEGGFGEGSAGGEEVVVGCYFCLGGWLARLEGWGEERDVRFRVWLPGGGRTGVASLLIFRRAFWGSLLGVVVGDVGVGGWELAVVDVKLEVRCACSNWDCGVRPNSG